MTDRPRNHFEALIDSLPEDIREQVKQGLENETGIGFLRSFVDQYDDNSSLDQFMARILSSSFLSVSKGIAKEMREGDGIMNSIRATEIAIKELRFVADQLEMFHALHKGDIQKH